MNLHFQDGPVSIVSYRTRSADVSLLVQSVRSHRCARCVLEMDIGRIVHVQDGVALLLEVFREKHHLRFPVSVEGLVVVQVFPGEIRKDARGESQSGQALPDQAVRGNFHDDAFASPVPDLPQGAVQLHRIGRGVAQLPVEHIAHEPAAQRADPAHGPATFPKDSLDQQ